MFEGLQAIRKELKEAKLENPDREEIHDGYQLRFVGKDYAKFITGLPTETVLVPDTEWNNQEQNKNSENIFITGDNLDALKHLENAYSGRIKMIYIDPLYNTGSDGFAYNDKFGFSEEQLKEKLGLTDIEVERIKALEGKCSHSAWLTFMLPRLVIAKRLLTSDGVLFISIDDNEQANLRLLCGEIFTDRYVDVMVWRKSGVGRDGKMKNTTTFRKDHEYVLVCFNQNQLLNKSFEKPKWENEYGNPDNDPRGGYKPGSISKKEEASDPNHKNYYTVVSPTGKEFTRQFDIPKEDFLKLDKDNRIYWGAKLDAVPALKIFQNEKRIVTTSSYIVESSDYLDKCVIDSNDCTTTQGSKELDELLKKEGVGNEMRPKPEELLLKLIQIGSNKDSIILDFFAGSATTAHSVISLNNEDKSSNRKYIMVQLDEQTPKDSQSRKAGYESIDQISRARIKKAAELLGDTSGFKHYKLAKVDDKNVLDKIDTFNPDNKNLVAEDMLKPFTGEALNTGLTATGTQTLLTTWLVDDGYVFTTPVKEEKFGGYTAYMPQDSHRLYLIDTGWNSEATKDLLNKIGKNNLIVQSIVIYNHSFDFTTLTELKNNLKFVLNNDIKLIERF